ncbi:hypothetical protein [Paenibacillus fonticola]|nr:hypothetical protein [Paenibacillus fonticola]
MNRSDTNQLLAIKYVNIQPLFQFEQKKAAAEGSGAVEKMQHDTAKK